MIIDTADQPRITDFGLAKRLGGTRNDELPNTDLTLTGQVLGSPNFMSPEQAGGNAQGIGPPADVYSLGALLYHILTRQPPFQAETLTTLLKLVTESDPVSPGLINRSIPRDLQTICLKCLEKEARNRYATAQDLAEDLGRFLETQPIRARPVGLAGKAWKWCRRRPALAGMGAALACTLGVGFSGVAWQWHRTAQMARAELEQRRRAEASEYAAEMNLAQLALENNNRSRAAELLEKHRPTAEARASALKPATQSDLRGWEWRYLWQLCRGDKAQTLHRYPRGIIALAVSNDGTTLATATGTELALWNLATKRPITNVTMTTTEALAFVPNGGQLVVGTVDKTRQPGLVFWDVKAGKEFNRLKYAAQVRSVAFSPDGRLVATLDNRGDVKVQEWITERTLTNLSAGTLRARPTGVVSFSPDGKRLAIGAELGTVRLLDLQTGMETELRRETISGITALTFSPAADLLAAGIGSEILLWDTRSGELRTTLTNHTAVISGLGFTPDGQQFVSAGWDRAIRVWSVGSCTEVVQVQNSIEALSASSLLPGGRMLVTGGNGGSVCLWDLTASTKAPAQTHLRVSLGFESFVGVDPRRLNDPKLARRFGLAFTPDTRNFIATDRAGALEVRDTRTLLIKEGLASLGSNYWAVALSPDARWLAAGNTSGKLMIWDWTSRGAVTNFAMPFGWFGKLRFSRSGRFLFASVVADNEWAVTTRAWRTGTWEEIRLPEKVWARHWSSDLSGDDRLLAVGYAGGGISTFRFPSGSLEREFTGHRGGVIAVLFSPNGDELVSASVDGGARVSHVSGGPQVPALKGHLAEIYGEAISPDGRRLATGGSASTDAVKLWDPLARRELITLQAQGENFLNLLFSPDGNVLVAQSLDGHTHLWHAPSWEEIAAAEKNGPN